jgi:hypothetical protein
MRKPSRLHAGLGSLIALSLVSGLVQGRLTHRWGPPADLRAAARRFKQIPAAFGAWRLSRTHSIPAPVVAELQCAGYINGVWEHRLTGEVVRAFVLLGPAGPTAVHTPEVCYSSRDYQTTEPPARISFAADGTKHAFWAMTLRKPDVHADQLRVCYAWSDGGAWEAPAHPRFRYGGASMLYKIQLAAHRPSGTSSEHRDACRDFLEAFVPALERALFQ